MNTLRGMEETLRLFHPSLLIEVHLRLLGMFGASAEELLTFLSARKVRA